MTPLSLFVYNSEVHEMLLQTTCLVLTPPLIQARYKGRDVPAVDVLAMLLKNGWVTG